MDKVASIFTSAKPVVEPPALWSVASPRRAGSFQGKLPFDDIDALEGGQAREYLTEECLSPRLNKVETAWTHCKMHKINKTSFK
jgi:hypothetical protein